MSPVVRTMKDSPAFQTSCQVTGFLGASLCSPVSPLASVLGGLSAWRPALGPRAELPPPRAQKASKGRPLPPSVCPLPEPRPRGQSGWTGADLLCGWMSLELLSVTLAHMWPLNVDENLANFFLQPPSEVCLPAVAPLVRAAAGLSPRKRVTLRGSLAFLLFLSPCGCGSLKQC